MKFLQFDFKRFKSLSCRRKTECMNHRDTCASGACSVMAILHSTNCLRNIVSVMTILHRTNCLRNTVSVMTILHSTNCLSNMQCSTNCLRNCKLNIVLISLWGLMHKIYPTSRYKNVSSLSFWDQYYNIAPYFCATKCD